MAQFRSITGSGDPSHDSHDLELGQAPFSAQQGSIPPLHADTAAAADAAAAAATNSSSLHPEVAAGEQLAAVVAAEVSRKRLEGLYESSDRLVHQPDGSSRDLASPADDEQLPLLAELGAHPNPAQHHTAAAAPAGSVPAAAGAVPTPSSSKEQASSSGEAAAGAEAAPAMIGGGIPRSIFVLSMVSMALTSASCVFNTLLPIYMVTELKMTMRTMGMFEGETGQQDGVWEP